MKFHVTLKDPFGTVSGEGEITMNDTSVFASDELTADDVAGQVRQVVDEKYAQGTQVPWYIELSEVV